MATCIELLVEVAIGFAEPVQSETFGQLGLPFQHRNCFSLHLTCREASADQFIEPATPQQLIGIAPILCIPWDEVLIIQTQRLAACACSEGSRLLMQPNHAHTSVRQRNCISRQD